MSAARRPLARPARPLLASATLLPAHAAWAADAEPATALPTEPPVVRPDTSSSGTDAPAELPTPVTDELLEKTRRSVRSTTEWLASGLNSWFGDTPFAEGGKVSDGELSLGYFKRQDQGGTLPVRFNARLALPNLERRSYLFVGRDDDREQRTDTPNALSRREALLQRTEPADNTFFAGLGLRLLQSLDFRLGVHAGIKPYAQVRYRHAWEASEADRVEFRETLFATTADHLGATTVLSYTHAFSPTLVGRWLNSATVTQRAPDVGWTSNLGAYRTLSEQRLLSFELLASGSREPDSGLTNYGVQAKYERPLHPSWLRAELLLGEFWPRDNRAVQRHPAWAVGGTLKMSF